MHGAKKHVEEVADDEPDQIVTYADAANIFTPEIANQLWEYVSLASVMHQDPSLGNVTNDLVNWLEAAMLPAKRKPAEFALQLARRRGPAALTAPPACFVGTINSFKGGEADACYVFPDLSPSGVREWHDRAARNNIVRLFYVAFTRARQSLTICSPANARMSIPLNAAMSCVLNGA